MFTTRPDIYGVFGMASSTHWIASQTAMAMLERGGNAFDGAVAAAFALLVVEPHLCGPAGEVPILFRPAGEDEPQVLCGQGVAPRAATIEAFDRLGLDMVPGSGLIAAVTPGAFDAWMKLLRDYGTLEPTTVLEPAMGYALQGFPMSAGAAAALADVADALRTHWTSSLPVWLPGGRPPEAGGWFRNPVLAETWRRLLGAQGYGSRETRIDRMRRAWSQGFVAEAIDRFASAVPLMDASGRPHKGLITGQDMAEWEATYETPVSIDYAGWRIYKTATWGQGPVLLQTLNILKGFDLDKIDLETAEGVHLILEALKLAFADREAYYGDPKFVDVPLETLLSDAYGRERAALIAPTASSVIRPGLIPGFEDQARRALGQVREASDLSGGIGVGEPTMIHLQPTRRPGDTVHLDVIDRWGNVVSATPSGGWPQSSPMVPELGFALNTRAQMFWLEDGLPGSLAPGKRPRTTLTPTLARGPDGRWLSCGTPGGDQQDQWQAALILRYLHGGKTLQQAIDQPLFHSLHFPSSFFPREALPGLAVVEESYGPELIADLRRRGHEVQTTAAWTAGRLTAALREPGGVLRGAATPRLMQAYAVGR